MQEQLLQAQAMTPQKQLETQQQQLMFNALKNAFGGAQQEMPGQPAMPQPLLSGQKAVDLNKPESPMSSGAPDVLTQPQGVNVVREANPGMEQIDKAFYGNPLVRRYLESQGYKEKMSTHQSPETGQVFQTIEYPSGKIEQRVYRVGDRPEQVTERKEMAKEKVKFKGELANNYNDVQNTLGNIDYAIDLLEKNPDAKNVIGPMNQHLTRLFGSEADRELLGQVATTSGNVALDAAKSIKGAFTGRDLSLLNSVKFNPSDTYGQYLGKLKAMKILSERVAKKVEFVDDQLDKGVSRIKAEKMAREQIPIEPVREEAEQAMKGFFADQQQNIKVIGGKRYMQQNGKWYEL